MEELIAKFGEQLQEARTIASSAEISANFDGIKNVLLLGLGGSAFGGEVVKNLVSDSMQVPFEICRDYDIPAYVGPDTLVVVSSYSGNTEETLASMGIAMQRGARLACISSNGEVSRIAQEKGYSLISVPSGYPPRAAAGFSILQLLRILNAANLIQDFANQIVEAIDTIQKFDDHDEARRIAKSLKGKLTVMYSSNRFESVAIRWRQQIEENSKQLAFHHVVPEMNHNELVGWKNPDELLKNTAVLFFESPLDHVRNSLRIEINRQVIQPLCASLDTIVPKGDSHLAQLLYLIHFGDWVSLYLAQENGEDPMPVAVIDYLKSELAKK